MYARSSYNNLPGSVLLTDDSKKNPKDEEKTEEGRKKGEQTLCRIDFDLKNVKLKIPKVPFTIHGRLMAKDDFFPTVVASFQLQVTKEEVFDRRNDQPVTKNPDFIEVPLTLGTDEVRMKRDGKNDRNSTRLAGVSPS